MLSGLPVVGEKGNESRRRRRYGLGMAHGGNLAGSAVDLELDRRVLVLAPGDEDFRVCRRVLDELGVPWLACEEPGEAAREIRAGAAALLLTDQAMAAGGMASLEAPLDEQPSWSDLPVVALLTPGPSLSRVLSARETLGNVLFVERPVSEHTLGSALQVALRSRERQYESRDRLLGEGAHGDALQDREAEFRAIFELSGVGQAQVDPATGRFLRVNRTLCDLTGYGADELLAMTFSDLTHPDDRAEDAELVRQVVEGRAETWSNEKRYVRKDGEILWVEVTGTLVRDPAGHALRTVAVINDISETRRVAEALARSRAEFQAMFDAFLEAVIFADDQRHIRMVNPAFTTLFGYRPEEVLGRTTELLYAEKAAYEAQGRRRYGPEAPPPTEPYEVRYRRKDGTVFLAESAGTHVRDAQGNLVGFVSLHRDVTEDKASAERLQKSERDYRALVENLPGLVYRLDLRNGPHMHFFNDLVETMTGYDEEDLTRGEICSIDPLIVDGDRQRVLDSVSRAVADGEAFETTYRIRSRSGDLRYFLERGRPSLGEDGRPAFIDGVIFDVTVRENAKEALAESEERFRQLAENVEEVFFLVTPDWEKVLYISPAYEGVWGRSCQSLYESALSWLGAVVEEDRPVVQAAISERVAGNLSEVFPEYRIARPDGTQRWIEARAWPILDEHGRIYRVAGIATDITERKTAEEALRESRDELQAVYDSTSDGMLIADMETKTFVAANPAVSRILGYAEAELLSMTIVDLHPLDTRPAMLEAFEQAPGFGPRLIEAVPVLTKDGTLLRMDLSGRPIVFRGRPCVIAFLHDLTRRIQLQEELEQAKVAAEAASEAKSRFLANTSHDLRTPMNAILGMTNLALQEELSPTVRDYLETARDAGTTLLSLLDHVLDVSRIEAGRLDLESTPFSLRKIVEEVVKTLGPTAYEKGLELISEWPAEPPRHVMGDPSRLRQILFNLVDNAIKFTPAGEVVVRKEVRSEEGGETVVGFSVADTGIGIAEEDRERIFEPFLQADSSAAREYGGSGLGLAITAGLVRAMGGEIHVQSEPGGGTTFRFTVRLKDHPLPPAEADRHALYAEAFRDVSILVVAGSAAGRRALENMLANWSMRAESAPDAESALARLRQAAIEGNPFRLVLAERDLEGTDGAALARSVEAESGIAGGVILMVSPRERLRDPHRCSELKGVCLEKPVLHSNLAAAMASALGITDRARGPADSGILLPIGKPGASLRVLVAEDTPAGQKFVHRLLTRRGHQVVVAVDGREALERVKNEEFDLVLMDVQMPRMDGLEATKAIRALPDPARAGLPIVALTAHAFKGESERCLSAGMDAYLSKPVDGGQLIQAVERMGGASRDRTGPSTPVDGALPEEPAGAPQPPLPTASAARGDTTERVFDLEEARSICFGDEEILRDLVEYFFQESGPLLSAIEDAAHRSDAPELAAHAHRLNNTVLFLAAHPAGEAVARVQHIGESGDLAGAPEAIDQLAQELEILGDALSRYRQDTDDPPATSSPD